MSVLSMVSDPQFQSLDPTDQQKALAGIDPDFGNLNQSDFSTAVTGLQKQAISRPDLLAPPKSAGLSQPMQTSALGTLDNVLENGGAPVSSPKSAGSKDIANNLQTNTAGDLSTGALDSALKTVHTALVPVGKAVQATTGSTSLPTSFDEPDTLNPEGTAQNLGASAESILEFMTGDEALKGLSLSSKLGLASKVAELSESSPTLAKAINIGLNAVRQGAVTGGETLAKGGTATDALEAGAGAAALSGAAQSVLPAFGALKNLVTPADVQPELQSGIRSILGNAVDLDQPESIRDAAQSAGDSKYADAKSNFKILDDATGGNVSRFDDQLKNVNRAIQNVTDDDEEAKLLTRKATLEAGQEAAFEQAKAAGVDPALVDQAKTDYKQAQALYDLDSTIKKSVVSTSGRPGVTPADALAKNPETVDPKKLATRVNAMYDSGRLQDALGEDGAKDLFNHANAQYQNFATATRKATIASKAVKGAAKVALGAAGLGVLGHAAKHLISVEADPTGSDSTDTDAPDVPPAALSGSPSSSSSLDSLNEAPVMPRQATGRDYLDNPDTQSALESLYAKASPTFMPPSMGSTTQENEHLISIDNNGKQNSYSQAPAGTSRHLETQIPAESSAIIHTHPYKANPVPSDTDYKTATAEGKPNFVLSRNAIYVAMPGTDPKTTSHIKVADVTPGKHGKLNIKWNQ